MFNRMSWLSLFVTFIVKEIHIMHEFQSDFYGHHMKAVVLGYIRPELDYTSRGDYLFSILSP